MDIEISFSTENLHSFDDAVNVKQRDKGRINRYKMSLANVMKILNSSASYSKMESPFLPNNCVKFTKTAIGYEVFIEIPKRKWMINFHGNMFEVGFPRLLFKYDCIHDSKEKGYGVELSRIVAVKGNDRITGETPLFQFPYSHVQEKGNVCMGGNKLENVLCLSELQNRHTIFFHSPFSTDYGAKTKLGKSVAELFSAIFNQKDFDDEALLPIDKTFNQLFLLGTE